MELVRQGLPRVLALHREHVFERFFLRAENLNFLLVCREALVEHTARFCEASKLTFQMRSVVAGQRSFRDYQTHENLVQSNYLQAPYSAIKGLDKWNESTLLLHNC